MLDAFPPHGVQETMAPARAPRQLGPFSFRNPAFEIRTVSKIEQRGAAQCDRVAADAIADLRHPEIRRPRCVTRVEAVLLISAEIDSVCTGHVGGFFQERSPAIEPEAALLA
jgi:hypothetical protein